MATITNQFALEALSMLRRSGIEGFEKIPRDEASWDIDAKKAKFLLIRLGLLGKGSRQEIDPTDLQEVNAALVGKRQPAAFYEQRVVNLASEFQRKFGVTIPVRLSNGKLWEPKKTDTPSAVVKMGLKEALEADKTITPASNNNIITFNSRYNDRILAFLQGTGLTQRDGVVITHIKPGEIRRIKADLRYVANYFEDFKNEDQKTVIYRITYYDKDFNTEVTREIEVKPSDIESKNGYLKDLATVTQNLVQPQLIKK